MTTPTVEFQGVRKTYRTSAISGRSVEALHAIHLQVEPGEALALVGPNRAGKTTLLKTLLGLCRPTSGVVYRFGKPASDLSSLGRVGYMHENQAFPFYLNASRLLDYYGRFAGLSPAVLRLRIPELLERLGLADRAQEPISRFSKGMVQRLALAQAILNEPDLLVLDEPTEGLDLHARQILGDVINAHRDAGKTVVVVSHALGQVARVCDRLAVLVAGRLVHLGPIDELLIDPATGLSRSLDDALAPIYGL